MARKIITLCDPHLTEHDEEVPGEPYRLGVETPGGKWVWIEIDLCEADAAEMAQFSAWLDKYGRAFDGPDGTRAKRPYKRRLEKAGDAEAPADESGEGKCPLCEHVAKNRSSLRSHVRRAHGKSISEAEGTPEPFVCGECGETFSRAQGLGVHTRRKHPTS